MPASTDTLRVVDQAVKDWLGGIILNYANDNLGDTSPNLQPIIRVTAAPERAYAAAKTLLVQRGFIVPNATQQIRITGAAMSGTFRIAYGAATTPSLVIDGALTPALVAAAVQTAVAFVTPGALVSVYLTNPVAETTVSNIDLTLAFRGTLSAPANPLLVVVTAGVTPLVNATIQPVGVLQLDVTGDEGNNKNRLFPVCSIQSEGVTASSDRFNGAAKLRMMTLNKTTYGNRKYPTPYERPYTINFMSPTKFTDNYINGWIMGQFSNTGAGVNERVIPVEFPAPWGMKYVTFSFDGISDSSDLEVSEHDRRIIRSTLSLRVNFYNFDLSTTDTTPAVLDPRVEAGHLGALAEFNQSGGNLGVVFASVIYDQEPLRDHFAKESPAPVFFRTERYGRFVAELTQTNPFIEFGGIPVKKDDYVQVRVTFRAHDPIEALNQVFLQVGWRDEVTNVLEIVQNILIPSTTIAAAMEEPQSVYFASRPDADTKRVVWRMAAVLGTESAAIRFTFPLVRILRRSQSKSLWLDYTDTPALITARVLYTDALPATILPGTPVQFLAVLNKATIGGVFRMNFATQTITHVGKTEIALYATPQSDGTLSFECTTAPNAAAVITLPLLARTTFRPF